MVEHESTPTPGSAPSSAALDELIRELIVEGTREGLDAARGPRLGRPPGLWLEQVHLARELHARSESTVASIARLLGVSRFTLYKNIPELSARQQSAPVIQASP